MKKRTLGILMALTLALALLTTAALAGNFGAESDEPIGYIDEEGTVVPLNVEGLKLVLSEEEIAALGEDAQSLFDGMGVSTLAEGGSSSGIVTAPGVVYSDRVEINQWVAMQTAINMLANGSARMEQPLIKLMADLVCDGGADIPQCTGKAAEKGIILDLNGHSLKLEKTTSLNDAVFCVQGGNFVLTNRSWSESNPDKLYYEGKGACNGVVVKDGGKFTLASGGVIEGFTVNVSADSGGTFIMESSSKVGKTTDSLFGRSVGVAAGGTFTMEGGMIDSTIEGGVRELAFAALEISGNGANATINAGTIKGKIFALKGGLTIKGGSFAGARIELWEDCTLTVGPTVAPSLDIEASVENHGTISGGTFTGTVENKGTISGGEFRGAVTNHGKIIGGTFTGAVTNLSGGVIQKTSDDVTLHFIGAVKNYGTIAGGDFYDEGDRITSNVENYGTISGGMFSGKVTNQEGGIVTGGSFSEDEDKTTGIYLVKFYEEPGENARLSATQWRANAPATPPTVTKAGSILRGWYTNGGGESGTQYIFDGNLTENLTLTAVWISKGSTVTDCTHAQDGVSCFGSDGKCVLCNFMAAAKIEETGTYYATVQAAVDVVQNGQTITLQGQRTMGNRLSGNTVTGVRENVVVNRENVAFTIDLLGYTWAAKPNMNSMNSAPCIPLTVEKGVVTLTNDYDLETGLYGKIEQQLACDSTTESDYGGKTPVASPAIKVTGGSLIVSPKNRSYELALTGGTNQRAIVVESGGVSLETGVLLTGGIKAAEGHKVVEYLASSVAYGETSGDRTIINGDVVELTTACLTKKHTDCPARLSGEACECGRGSHQHYECGKSYCTAVGHSCESKTWTVWSSTATLPTTAGHYHLTNNVTLSATWEPADGTALCLNGHTITANGEFDAISVPANSTFILTDCGTNGKITHASGKTGSGVYVKFGSQSGGTFKMYGGTITGNNADRGGGVDIGTSGTFYLYGGTISNNSATYIGGGVNNGGSFYMYGGTITGNTINPKSVTSGSGGGVYNSGGGDGGSKFEMRGGTITKNTAKLGGGVYNGNVTFGGAATVKNNTATEAGANFLLGKNSKFTVETGFTGSVGVSAGAAVSDRPKDVELSTGGADYAACFTSDQLGYAVEVSGNGLKLVKKTGNCAGHADANSDALCDYCGDFLTATLQYTTTTPEGGVSAPETVEHTEWYPSFQDALTAANGKDNAVVTLLRNVTTDATIDGGTLTLKLNGKQISSANTLTIKDGSSVTIQGDGQIYSLAAAPDTVKLYGGTYNKLEVVNPAGSIDDATKLNNFLPLGYVYQYTENNKQETKTLSDYQKFGYNPAIDVIPCPHNNFGDDNNCTVCGEGKNAFAAQIGDVIYSSFSDAHDAVKTGETIKLLADVSIIKNAIDNKSYTLDLNGKVFDYGIAGYWNISGSVTLRGSGRVTIGIDVQSGGSLSVESEATFEGVSVANGGTVNISGGTFKGLVDIYYDGTANISGGTFSGLDISANDSSVGTANISGGTFNKIIVDEFNKSSKTLADTLAPGYAFFLSHGSEDLQSAAGKELEKSVKIEEHTCTYAEGADGVYRCGCGRTCTQHFIDMTTLKCQVCGAPITGLPATVTITGAPTSKTYGDSFTLTAAATADGVTGNLTGGSWNWSVSDSDVFSLSASGSSVTVTAKKASAAGATITATYLGDNNSYTGTATTTAIKVDPKAVAPTIGAISGTFTYDGTAKMPEITVTVGTGSDTVTLTKDTDYTVTYEDNRNAGVAKVSVSAVENGNYTWTDPVTTSFTIDPATLTGAPSYTLITSSGKTLADANLTKNAGWPEGTFTWANASGEPLPNDTAVKGSVAYTWKFTPSSSNYNPISGSVTLWDGTEPPAPTPPAPPVNPPVTPVTPVNPVLPVTPSKPVEPTKKPFPFKDVLEGDWFYADVVYAYENGLMNGTDLTTFSPYATTTRGMIVTLLYRLAGEPAVSGACPFGDVASGAYYEAAVVWAAENGLVGGYGNGRFGPEDSITREQLAVMLYRFALLHGVDDSAGEDTNILSYSDALDVSDYALSALQWACGAGLLQGSDGALLPQGDALRAQVAAILHRFCEGALK